MHWQATSFFFFSVSEKDLRKLVLKIFLLCLVIVYNHLFYLIWFLLATTTSFTFYSLWHFSVISHGFGPVIYVYTYTHTHLTERQYVPWYKTKLILQICFLIHLVIFFSKLHDMSQSHLNSRIKGLKLYKNHFKVLSYCLRFEMLRFYLSLYMIFQ